MSTNWVGKVILDRYRVDRFIDSGGMGAVYQVWDLHRSVPLAMKMLHVDLAEDPAIFRRFQREAKALKNLKHPNIVPFYGIEQFNDITFILEAYIDGPTLKRVLTERKVLPIPEALTYLKALCSSLGYAHASRTVHCDVKPGNVMVDCTGSIFLTDFGIARQADATTTTTFASSGTPAYMAPEQVRGEQVSQAADIYALGILLFEMLTGQRPFRGSEVDGAQTGPTLNERIRYAQIHLPAPDPRSINPNLSENLAAVILKALQKDPRKRYQSALALFEAACEAANMRPNQVPDRVAERPTAAPRPIPGTMAANAIPAVIGPAPVSPASQMRLPVKIIPALFAGGAVALLVLIILLATRHSPAPPGPASTAKRAVSGISTAAPTKAIAAVAPTAAAPPVRPTQSLPPLAPTNTLWPTNSPVVQNVDPVSDPFNAPMYNPIPGCAPSHVHVDDWVMITYGGTQNAIRSTTDTHPSNNVIGHAEPGELIRIIEGPICNYGWLLWRVQTSGGLIGWTPESDGASFFVEPFPSKQVCSGAPNSLLHPDDQAQVTLYPPLSNRVRSKASLNGAKVGTIDPGDKVTITGGPECADGYVWWKIQFNGLAGWTAEGDSSNYYLVPVPKPH